MTHRHGLVILYHFCRLQAAAIALPAERFQARLQQMFERLRLTETNAGWEQFQKNLYALDAYLAAACLEGAPNAWETLFAARAGRADRLLVDALRARAVRLYPRDEERQEVAVNDFWGHLIVAETPGAVPILARYDGQRPLVPWLIRVFQNWQISLLRSPTGKADSLAEDDLLEDRELPAEAEAAQSRWHESFCDAARRWLAGLGDQELLLLGLRIRYRLSQREVAGLLGVHEGTISRQITQLRDRCFEVVGRQLLADGWTGDDLSAFVYNEMSGVVLDEPRLSADNLARILSGRGKKLPA